MTDIDKTADSEIRRRCQETLDGKLAACGATGRELVFLDDLDGAVIGIGTQAGHAPCVVYDRQRCLELIAERLGPLSVESAEEHFEEHVADAYVGSGTPLFLEWVRNEE